MFWADDLIFEGFLIGLASLIVIGALHPVVIKGEYYFGTRPWPLFLLIGAGCVAGSLFVSSMTISAIAALTGFAFLWSIKELFDQRDRVAKGWFPSNPDRLARERAKEREGSR